MLSEIEKKIVASIQEDIPIEENPYETLARKVGITEEKFLKTLEDLCNRGVIRRFGATIRHQISGYGANAMTAWRVDERRVDEVGTIMAASGNVSHCYRRNPTGQWPYNLYTMIHAVDETACRTIAESLSIETGIKTYLQLFSLRELKKTSMKYFPDL